MHRRKKRLIRNLPFGTWKNIHLLVYTFTHGASTLHTSPSTLQVVLLLYKGSFYFTRGASTLQTAFLLYTRRFYFTHSISTIHTDLPCMRFFYFTKGGSTMHAETPPPLPGVSGAQVGRKMNMAGDINSVASDPQPRKSTRKKVLWFYSLSPRPNVKSNLEKKSSNEQGNAHYGPRPAKVANL